MLEKQVLVLYCMFSVVITGHTGTETMLEQPRYMTCIEPRFCK